MRGTPEFIHCPFCRAEWFHGGYGTRLTCCDSCEREGFPVTVSAEDAPLAFCELQVRQWGDRWQVFNATRCVALIGDYATKPDAERAAGELSSDYARLEWARVVMAETEAARAR
jgi:hypothetical protein